MAVIDSSRGVALGAPDRRDARATGLAYLGLAVSGLLGFLLIRPQLFDAGDPGATLAHLLEHETLARIGIALDPVVENGSQLMYVVSEHLWGVGNVFFGLWLIPMGTCVLRSGWAPRPLGWILVAGGVGYLLSAFVAYLLPDLDLLVAALPVPATVGGVWMIGWLLVTGWRPG